MHLAHIDGVSCVFPKRTGCLLLDSVGLYQLLSRDKLVVIVFAGFVFSASIPGGNSVASSVSHWGEMGRSDPFLGFPSAQTIGPWRFSVPQKHLYMGEIHIHLCKDLPEENRELKEREKICVCTQAMNAHAESHKGLSGEPTLKVNAAPGCN